MTKLTAAQKKKFGNGKLTTENVVDFILSFKPIRAANFDDDFIITEAALAKRKTRTITAYPRDVYPDTEYVDGTEYLVVDPKKLTKLTTVEVVDDMGERLTITEEDAKKLASNMVPTIRIHGDALTDVFTHLSYSIIVTEKYMQIGCQKYSWAKWARQDTQEDALLRIMWNVERGRVADLLRALIKGRKRIIEALS